MTKQAAAPYGELGPGGSVPAAVAQLQPVPGEPLAEAAVVGDGDHCSRVRRERRLQVLDEVERDVVRRLVEDEEVRGPGRQDRDL